MLNKPGGHLTPPFKTVHQDRITHHSPHVEFNVLGPSTGLCNFTVVLGHFVSPQKKPVPSPTSCCNHQSASAPRSLSAAFLLVCLKPHRVTESNPDFPVLPAPSAALSYHSQHLPQISKINPQPHSQLRSPVHLPIAADGNSRKPCKTL